MSHSPAIKIFMLTLTLILASVRADASPGMELDLGVDATSMVPAADSLQVKENLKYDWKAMLKTRRLEVTDTNIVYPKFIDFCLRVYRWAEKTFNTYDSEYVAGTGKHGKVRILSDHWNDSYYFRFEDISPLLMSSHPYSNLGIQANYSILSATYSVDMNSTVSGEPSHHRKWGFSFTAARLYGEANYWSNSGSTVIRRFGNNETGKLNDIYFDGINFKALGLLAFYVFNSKKFSYAAAYNLSNYQLKSAGSWLAGISGTLYDCDFDFSRLPQDVLDKTQIPFEFYRFEYNSVNVLGGYSYNWVLNKHFLFNTTTLPGIGVSFCFSDATLGKGELFSLAIRQTMSLTYTNRQFFITANGAFHGNILPTHAVAFMSGIANLQVSTGVRF